MFDDEKLIRFHLPVGDFDLEGEPAFAEKYAAGVDWDRQHQIPENETSPTALRAHIRNAALTEGGEWRAMSARGELLFVYSVSDLAKELRGGRECITMQPLDSLCLALASARLGVAA
jgi:hypothetical protein